MLPKFVSIPLQENIPSISYVEVSFRINIIFFPYKTNFFAEYESNAIWPTAAPVEAATPFAIGILLLIAFLSIVSWNNLDNFSEWTFKIAYF